MKTGLKPEVCQTHFIDHCLRHYLFPCVHLIANDSLKNSGNDGN